MIFALRGRDAPVMGQLLDRMGHVHVICDSIDALAANMADGASMAIVTEESLGGSDRAPLDDWLGAQPPWSDFPFILLATKRVGRRPPDAQRMLDGLGNVVVLERPIHSDTLVSAVASAFRVRRRQYEARRRLLDLQAIEERLTQLNGSLESRIAERTRELSDANNQLMQEVAERERIQSALVQSQKMEAVGQLTGGIAHDFNNLLTVISGNLELIEHRVEDPRVLRLAGFARHATSSAAKLTHQLLAFSRTQQLTLTPVDLNALVEGMNDILERTIGPQVEKKWILDPASPWVMADTNQLELAILNLAINARDAMPRGGTLSITTGMPTANASGLREGSYATVTVADTGSGIPPHLLSKVFDPFFTTKAVGKGTGLGLSQVFGIARQSGGSAVLESEEGVGTSVSIWLPRAEAVTQAATVAPVAAASRREGGRILVIDDDDGVRRFMTDCLESLGYKVWEAADGPTGLDILKQQRPDLLLVDFAMAGMNGAEVVREAHRVRPDLPVIMATGYAEFDAADQPVGIHQILRKPFQIGDLSEALGAALAHA
ncbi:response regulator [Sphingomonas sp. LT1P40]|uniref:response regulator n=1 Tax=Alteristakelama amylovorans TaxID=3096166 RepID=UPI002FC647BC